MIRGDKVSPAQFTERYKSAALSILLAAYALNYIDRVIIAVVGPAVKLDLKLTDTQLGSLGGLFFALLYTIAGVPIARLAERFNRVNIIAASIVVWSGFTALCGTAQNFAQLAACRFGVGFGEAGLTPTAHSLISDYYPPRRRASALSIYAIGIPLGSTLGAVLGGWLAQTFSWRAAFLVVGAPGLAVALVMKLFLREPARGGSEAAVEGPGVVGLERRHWLQEEIGELGAVARIMFCQWSSLNLLIGVTISAFGATGAIFFEPAYFIRRFDLSYSQVGLYLGLVSGASSVAGMLMGGFFTDRLGRRSPRWYGLVPAIGLTSAVPIYLAAYSQTAWPLALLILLAPGALHYSYVAPTWGAIQNMVENRRRATASSLMFFVMNIIGLAFGPLFAGWMIDHLAQFNFTHPGLPAWGHVNAMLTGARPGDESFKALCPGGKPAAGAATALAGRCHAALALATRQGIMIQVCFYLWAAFHYLLSTIGMTRLLEAQINMRAADRTGD